MSWMLPPLTRFLQASLHKCTTAEAMNALWRRRSMRGGLTARVDLLTAKLGQLKIASSVPTAHGRSADASVAHSRG